jgi:hypothetical protein
MENEKVTYSPKDAKLIKDNPGKSPYELQALGLSGKGFEKLMSQQSTGTEPVADPTIKEEDESAQAPGVDPYAYQEPPADPEEQEDNQEDDDVKDMAPAPPKTAPLIPKITQIKQPQTPARAIKLHPNQVLVQTPAGRLNPMGREFAEKLVRMDRNYKIIR